MKSRLQDNDIEMYSTHNEGKSVVAERFIRTLKTLQYQKMQIFINIHRTIKIKPTDVKDNTYIY